MTMRIGSPPGSGAASKKWTSMVPLRWKEGNMTMPNWHKEYPPRYDEEAFQAKKPPRTWWILLILAVGYTILIPITWIDTNNFWRWFLIGMGWGGVCLIAVRIQKRRIAIHRFLRWDFRRWG